MFRVRSAVFLVLEISIVMLGVIFLWYKILLPLGYYSVAVALTLLIVVQVLTKNQSKVLAFQIALLYLFTNSVYYISTNYSIIPFNDGNWDYAVIRTFMQTGRIFEITTPNIAPANLLYWYSGWPILHSLAICVASFSGIDVNLVCIALPILISMTSFLFIYLFIEKVRVSLGLSAIVTNIGLLIYATSAEAQFWQIQYVRQNLGLVMLFATIYFVYFASTSQNNSRKYKILAIFFALSAVMVHDFTSVIIALLLSFLFIYQPFWEYFTKKGRTKVVSKIFSTRSDYSSRRFVTSVMFLLTVVFLFLWWEAFGTKAWSTVGPTLDGIVRLFSGVKNVQYTPRPAYYPLVLTPTWGTLLLRLRDVLTYAPPLFGFLIVLFRGPKSHTVSFVVGSSLAFGLLFLINNFLFNVEAFRTFMLASPLIALLGSIFIVYVAKRLGGVGKSLFVGSILIVLIFSSFVGLWGHDFVPIQIYDPSKNSVEIGERNTDFMRVNDFFTQRIPIYNYQVILVDDDPSLVHLLQPADYLKIRRLLPSMPTYTFANATNNTLACELKDLNLYSYYSGPASQIKNPQDAMAYSSNVSGYLANNFDRIYDDGKYRFWVSEVHK